MDKISRSMQTEESHTVEAMRREKDLHASTLNSATDNEPKQ